MDLEGIEVDEFDPVLDGLDAQIQAQLPFVQPMLEGLSYWQPDPVGHNATDIETGTAYCVLAIRSARALKCPMLLALIMRDMISSGKFTGVEAGYIAVVGAAAMAGVLN